VGIRINPNPLADLVTGLALDRQQEDQALQELSTGKKVNQPSDDPAAVAGLIVNNAQTSRVNAYLSNISTLQDSLQEADSTLNSVVTSLTQAVSLATEGANGTLNQTDRDSLVQEVNGIQQQILEYANQSFEGNYLFAGTAVNTTPFVTDSSSSSGVSYKGNSGVNRAYKSAMVRPYPRTSRATSSSPHQAQTCSRPCQTFRAPSRADRISPPQEPKCRTLSTILMPSARFTAPPSIASTPPPVS
jgi:flagellin-like hook-associated protein FlgL